MANKFIEIQLCGLMHYLNSLTDWFLFGLLQLGLGDQLQSNVATWNVG